MLGDLSFFIKRLQVKAQDRAMEGHLLNHTMPLARKH